MTIRGSMTSALGFMRIFENVSVINAVTFGSSISARRLTRLGHGTSVTRDVNVGNVLSVCERVFDSSKISVSCVGQLGYSLSAFDQFVSVSSV